MKNLLLLLLIVITSCVSGQKKNPSDKTETDSSNNIETGPSMVNVALNETVTMDGISISFTEVLEDSRCPTGVQCIWAGRAKLNVAVANERKSSENHVIIFGETKPEENTSKMLFESKEFNIEASELIPYPKEGEEANMAYVLVLKKKNTK